MELCGEKRGEGVRMKQGCWTFMKELQNRLIIYIVLGMFFIFGWYYNLVKMFVVMTYDRNIALGIA